MKGNQSEGEKHKSCVMGMSETGGDWATLAEQLQADSEEEFYNQLCLS